MASEKQIIANQNNAQHAGVKSEEGKLKVRQNSFKHGLTSKSILASHGEYNESISDFEEILEELIISFNPMNNFEFSLIETMALAKFKMRRCDLLEVSCLTKDCNNFFNSNPVVLSIDPNQNFELVLRYRQSLEGQFYRALETLMRVKDSRIKEVS